MRVTRLIRACAVLGSIATVLVAPARGHALAAGALAPLHVATQHPWSAAQLPVSFEVNRGQAAKGIDFVAHAGMSTAAISATGITFQLAGGAVPRTAAPGEEARLAANTRPASVRLRFIGARSGARVQGTRRLPGVVNYLFGNDPHAWLRHIPTYAGITVHDVYPGIDVAYHGAGQQLEYDWIVHPGADASRIRFQLAGSGLLDSGSAGSLVVRTGAGSVIQQAPVVRVSGAQSPIAARYVRGGASIAGFALGRYDPDKTLVIDPVIKYASYLGGSMVDAGKGISVDASGDMYVTGITASPDFPTKNAFEATPAKDDPVPSHAFVTKLNAAGNTMIFSTYLGGNGFEDGYAIANDATGVYVAGDTSSTDFPTVHAFQSTYGGGGTDAFIAKLTPGGDSLAYSSYLGGPADDAAYDMAIDGSGNAFLTGETIKQFHSSGGNAPPPLGHTYVAKVTADGALGYDLPIAGSFTETGYGVAADSQGNAYVVGITKSTDFPSNVDPAPGLIGPTDGFVVKVDPTGKNILYSTHLGGSDLTSADAVTVDADGNAYVSGQTAAPDFPVVGGFQRAYAGASGSFFPGDAFVAKLDPYGRVVYSTYLGGSRDDEANRIAIDHAKNIYVTGWTESADFPSKNAVQPAFTGAACVSINGQAPCPDAFAAEISSGGALAWSTFLGGSGSDFGNAIAVTPGGKVYVAGTTDSRDLLTVDPIRPQNQGNGLYALDAFMVEIDPGTTPVSHAIVVDSLTLYRQAGTQLVKTNVLRLNQRAVVLATYHDTRGQHSTFGTLQILRSGHQVLQYAMQVEQTGAQPDARATVRLASAGDVGALSAKVAIISDGATTEKTLNFILTR